MLHLRIRGGLTDDFEEKIDGLKNAPAPNNLNTIIPSFFATKHFRERRPFILVDGGVG